MAVPNRLTLHILIGSVMIRRNLSAVVCRNYTSPTTTRMSEPRIGASCRAVVEISECNYYRPQHLDSLRITEPISMCRVSRFGTAMETLFDLFSGIQCN